MANTYLFIEGVPGNLSLFGTQGWHRLQSFSWANPGGALWQGKQRICVPERMHRHARS